MNKIKEYINKIIDKENNEEMHCLLEMLVDTLEITKEYDYNTYEEYETKLYEIAEGEKIDIDIAEKWVNSMQPRARWTIEETTEAMQDLGYNFNEIDFYVVANMMYSDNYEIVKDNESLALQLAYNWLNDKDVRENKLYNYWKYVVKGLQ